MFDRMNEGRWWDFGWQLVEGCTPVSEGCKHCWSLAKEHRLGILKEVRCMESRIDRPLKRKKPAAYAIWNDLFHRNVSLAFIEKVMATIEDCPQHTFQVLTKRPLIMAEYFNGLGKRFALGNCPNLWLGTSVENQKTADERIPILLQIPAAVRFVSLEPLLGEINLCNVRGEPDGNDKGWQGKEGGYPYLNCLTGREYTVLVGNNTTHKLDWAIIGCETNSPKERRHNYNENAIAIVEQCVSAGVPVFVKSAIVNGRITKKIEEFPPELRLRQKPERINQ